MRNFLKAFSKSILTTFVYLSCLNNHFICQIASEEARLLSVRYIHQWKISSKSKYSFFMCIPHLNRIPVLGPLLFMTFMKTQINVKMDFTFIFRQFYDNLIITALSTAKIILKMFHDYLHGNGHDMLRHMPIQNIILM